MSRELSDRSVLVTGGGGFIGSFLTEELHDRGATVRVADNFSRGDRANLATVIDDIEVLPVDLRTYRGCAEAVAGIDDVFHLAASVGGIQYIQRENVGGLAPSELMNINMLDAAKDAGVERFQFASSACVYRQSHDGLNRFSEDDAIPANPHSTYGWAKLMGEIACRAYHIDTHLDTGAVRIFNCYGPRENLDPASSHVIPSLCRKIITTPPGGEIELFGDGSQERGFIYVTDLVEGMIRAMERVLDGQPLNLGNGAEVVSMTALAAQLIEISGKDLTITYDTSKPTGTDKYACDMTAMKAALDWTPSVRLADGLERVYTWVEDALAVGAATPHEEVIAQ